MMFFLYLCVVITLVFFITFPRQRNELIDRIGNLTPPPSVNIFAMCFLLTVGPILYSRKAQAVGVLLLLLMIVSNVL